MAECRKWKRRWEEYESIHIPSKIVILEKTPVRILKAATRRWRIPRVAEGRRWVRRSIKVIVFVGSR
jgi:hypothetical protein